jgi:hypothetical protein
MPRTTTTNRSPKRGVVVQIDLAQDDIIVKKSVTTMPVCYRHPEIETGLRCSRCEKYICISCTTQTEVSNFCPVCVRLHEDRSFTGGIGDYGIAAIIAIPLSIIAVLLYYFLIPGFGLFSWIIAGIAAPFTGGIIAEAVRRAVQKRRSRYLGRLVAGTLAAFCFLFLLVILIQGRIFGMIPLGILLFVGTGTILARLR